MIETFTDVLFLIRRGPKERLPAWAHAGQLLVTTDTSELFLGQGESEPLKQLTISVEDIMTLLTAPDAPKYVAGENILFEELDGVVAISSTAGDTTVIENEHTHTHHHYSYAVELAQVVKMGVLATKEKPRYVAVKMVETLDLVRPPVNVLKFVSSDNKMHTSIGYDNRDSTDFLEDSMMLYDGIMRLRVNHTIPVEDSGMLDNTYRLLTIPVDKTEFKNVQRVEVFGYGASVHE